MNRPYLIIPELVEQPTWGGDYIAKLKGWQGRFGLDSLKIGQSYELWGKSKLATDIFDSQDLRFGPSYESLPFEKVANVLGPGETMPLLIKINQALGNSFQLHIKPETKSDRWLPKPESWYFLEKGFISLGIRPETDQEEYRQTCLAIDQFMHTLSADISVGKLTLEEGRVKAREFIHTKNPWRFVNTYETNKYDLIDLSMGAVHHSWEENRDISPEGNIVFEVQLDSSDDEATIRSFDQGKIKDDGTVRTLAIDEYFKHLDTDPEHNTIEYMKRSKEGEKLLRTRFYSVDLLELSAPRTIQMKQSFHHLYVRDGAVEIRAHDVTVRVAKGHSCFVPSSVGSYLIVPQNQNSTLIQTFL